MGGGAKSPPPPRQAHEPPQKKSRQTMVKAVTKELRGFRARPKIFPLRSLTWNVVICCRNDVVISEQPLSWILHLRFHENRQGMPKLSKKVKGTARKLHCFFH